MRALLATYIVLAGCFDVAFGTAGSSSIGGGAAASTNGGDGGSGAAAAVGGAGGVSEVGGAGGSTVGGAGGCSAETCNGLDDDCDGFVDEPVSEVGEACGCTWVEFDGRKYVACPVPSFASATCPALTQIAVPQSEAELAFLATLPGAASQIEGFLGLAQSPGSPSSRSGWSWARDGLPIAGWDREQPDDFAYDQPLDVENGDEQCGVIRSGGLHDQGCTASAPTILCEEIANECIDSASCSSANLGCPGVFDCSVGGCVAQPVPESCNGIDDDCNGLVDDDDTCNCESFSDGFKEYFRCGPAQGLANALCPENFTIARVETAAEITFLGSIVPGSSYALIGLFQDPGETTLAGGWATSDGVPASVSWATNEPDDNDSTENAEEQCAMLNVAGLVDASCDYLAYYICEGP
jgi:hypothetical protein